MKIFKGKVVSTKMDKTATVAVDRVVSHPVYKKRYKRTKKYHVHAPVEVEVGQKVRFVACKPYSKMKKWILTEVEGKAVKADNSSDKKTTKTKVASKPKKKSESKKPKAKGKTQKGAK